ncbi:MAG TPA: AraC family transcriptional regulator [Puia sp.]|jgi:AraC-like DNA-binding protein|nr:AraC family transcriptional regulator [Puia sp.]
MEEILDLRDDHSFPLRPGLPDGYRGFILRGAISVSGQTASGTVVMQNLKYSDFAIQLGIYKFLHLVSCFLRPPAFQTGSFLALKNNLKSRIPEIGSLKLKENQFSFIHYGKEIVLADFKADKEYRFLEISCSEDMLTQTLLHFPGLADSFQRSSGQLFSSILTPQRPASDQTLKIVQDILRSSFGGQMNEVFLEDKIREYVWSLMIESSRKEEPQVTLNTKEKELLEGLGNRMKENPDGRFPISTLAREMGMNEMTFKLAFKQEFGKGIFEYHLDQRMKEAHRLLKNSHLPIKKIAGMVGYELTTSFITKFIEYFGYPPSRIQRK